MRWIALFALLMFAWPNHAQTVQKCSSKGGAMAYRSGDCLPGETLVAVRDGASDLRTPQPLQASQESTSHSRRTNSTATAANPRRKTPRASAVVSRATPHRKRAPAKDSCASMKLKRDADQQRRRSTITMADLSRWNNRVHDACK